jgi:CubicO group peptidase (beta-lactamase class C family)
MRTKAAFLLIAAAVLAFHPPAESGQRVLPSVNAEDVGMSASRLSLLDPLILEAVGRKDFPGAVCLVTRKGKTVWRKAYGDSQRVPGIKPMHPDMIFDLASLTKSVATATSVMILVERGRLRLQDRVEEFIPGFASYLSKNGSRGEPVRIWHLMTHTSGLPAYLDPDVIARIKAAHEDKRKIVQRIAGLDKAVPSGRKFVYSCLNYIVLGVIVESVSGVSLADFAEENIFRPLGMTKTFFTPPASMIDQCVPTEIVDGLPLRGTVHDPLARLCGGISGNAGLFSTADDLAVFAAMMLGQGAFGNVRILSPLSVRRMTEIYPEAKEAGRGLGWDLDSEYASAGGDLFGARAYGHTGYTGTSIWIDPETATAIIFLTNRVHPDNKGAIVSVRGRVANIVASSIVGD